MSRFLWSLVIATTFTAGSAGASPECSEKLISGGKVAVDAKLFDEGRALYGRAYTECKDPVALVHIAKSYQDEENWAKALEYVEQFLGEVDESHALYKPLAEAAVELRQKVAANPEPAPTGTGTASAVSNRSSLPVDIDDPVATPLERGAGPRPFVLLDRFGAKSSAGIDFTAVTSPDEVDATTFRFDAYLTHMLTTEVGLIASVPFTVLSFSQGDDSQTETALGSIEVGGTYVVPLRALTDVIVRASIGIPTASDEDSLINAFGANGRLGDFVLHVPLGVGRTSASVVNHFGPIAAARLDFGLEIPLYVKGDGEVEDRTPVIRIGGGAAVGGRTKGIAEAVVIIPPEDDSENLYQLGAFAAHNIGKGAIRGGLAFVLGPDIDAGDFLSLSLSYVSGY